MQVVNKEMMAYVAGGVASEKIKRTPEEIAEGLKIVANTFRPSGLSCLIAMSDKAYKETNPEEYEEIERLCQNLIKKDEL